MPEANVMDRAAVMTRLKEIKVGLKIEVHWVRMEDSKIASSGCSKGVLINEDDMFYLRKAPGLFEPFFAEGIQYAAIEVCREQSLPANRRLQRVREEDDLRPERNPQPRADTAVVATATTIPPAQYTPVHVAEGTHQDPPAQAAAVAPPLPAPYTPFRVADSAPRQHAPSESSDSAQPKDTPLNDGGLALEVVARLSDNRRVRAWGPACLQIRTVPTAGPPFGMFDLLSYRMQATPAEALAKWKTDREWSLPRLRQALAKPTRAATPTLSDSVAAAFIVKVQWAEASAHTALLTWPLPANRDEARMWATAGVQLLEAYCLAAGATARAAYLWPNFDKLWTDSKFDAESIFLGSH